LNPFLSNLERNSGNLLKRRFYHHELLKSTDTNVVFKDIPSLTPVIIKQEPKTFLNHQSHQEGVQQEELRLHVNGGRLVATVELQKGVKPSLKDMKNYIKADRQYRSQVLKGKKQRRNVIN